MHNAYIGIGTNIEPRFSRMQEALESLRMLGEPLLTSCIYETTPVGYGDQPDFLNAAMLLSTDMSAAELHTALKAMEQHLGRKHRERWHEREIDFDLLMFDNDVINTPTLTVPHPELHRRAFVLVPLAEIAPDLIHPILHESVSRSLAELGGVSDGVHVYSNLD
jgi:2-amino-4-hydroxy-6-hydroxymethyldihydropteridine diphosphokinase